MQRPSYARPPFIVSDTGRVPTFSTPPRRGNFGPWNCERFLWWSSFSLPHFLLHHSFCVFGFFCGFIGDWFSSQVHGQTRSSRNGTRNHESGRRKHKPSREHLRLGWQYPGGNSACYTDCVPNGVYFGVGTPLKAVCLCLGLVGLSAKLD